MINPKIILLWMGFVVSATVLSGEVREGEQILWTDSKTNPDTTEPSNKPFSQPCQYMIPPSLQQQSWQQELKRLQHQQLQQPYSMGDLLRR